MKDQLKLLWELQKIDLELKAIKEEKERYPKEIKKLDEKQKIEKERIQKEREKVESLEKTRRQKEGHLNVEQEKIKRAEGRMSEVKTNKEYQALLSEIDAMKGANSRIEEEILQVMDEIDELKKDLSKREKEMGSTLEKIEGERKKLQEKMAQGEEAWNERVERRDDLSKQIESKLVKLYHTLKEKRQGVGVVSVKNETCQGCFVNVPPQLFIEVQKNNALVRCPHCNRILYWEGDRNRK
ncbi:MAG TPA: C4-type zinc ribbon domain-containing protein [Thermodesulfobacteriota bacterium]|nr:C4-type zinc ribbon domain-containing protein [Thermodesulfobacteriota bacterium]